MRANATTGNALRLELGEGPVWDADRGEVLWVDSEAGLVLRGDLDGDALVVLDSRDWGESVGSVTPARDGGMLVAGEHHVHVVDASGRVDESIRILPEGQRSRLNDGSVDPAGRFLVGSVRLDDRVGMECLWSVSADRVVRRVVDGITVSNGLGFSPDGSTMYYVETRPGTILAFDYDVDTGEATGRREVLACGGTPDGLAVDTESCLWVAFFGEGQVRRISPRGQVLEVIEVDAPNVTCPEFVGPYLDRLLITTARYRMSAEHLRTSPLAGAVFIADASVPGLPVGSWGGATGGRGEEHAAGKVEGTP